MPEIHWYPLITGLLLNIKWLKIQFIIIFLILYIKKKKKKNLWETIKFFHVESRRGKFRNLPTSPFHSNISYTATRICVRLALPMPDRSALWLRAWMLTITFVACQMRRRIGDTRNFPPREWNSRDSNCFRKGLREAKMLWSKIHALF